MNKTYIVNEDGIVTITTEENSIIKKPYTRNTDTILSLENLSEFTENKINFNKRKVSKLNLSIRQKRKIIRLINTSLLISLFPLIIVLSIISSELIIPLLITSISSGIMIGLIEKFIINIDQKKRDKHNNKITILTHQLDKIQKRIETLSKDKEKVIPEKVNEPIEVKPIYEYKFDPTDYFVEKYMVDKRIKEFSKDKKNSKKLSRKQNDSIYRI